MADAVSTIVQISGQNRYVARFTNESDGTGESAVIKVNKSDLTGPDGTEPSKLVIESIDWNVQGFNFVKLAWDHTTDDVAAILSGEGWRDYTEDGGLVDPGSAGGTGDIVLTTDGASTYATYDIVLRLRLKD